LTGLLWGSVYLVIRVYYDRHWMRYLPRVALAGLCFALLMFALGRLAF
jgi:hypothetical protein